MSRYHKPSFEEDEVPTQFLLSRLSSLIDYALDSSTTLSKVCEHLVTDTLVACDCHRVSVRRVDGDGTLRTVASFGVDAEIPAGCEGAPFVSDHPSNLAIESGALVTINFDSLPTPRNQQGKGRTRCPEISNVIAYPLDERHVLEIAFGSSSLLSPQIRLLMGVVGSVVAASLRLRGAEPRPAPAALALEGARSLTERQLRILAFMTEGLSNFQIAQRIGYSDSTVRQETMRIYAALGFKNRVEAIAWYRKALRMSQ